MRQSATLCDFPRRLALAAAVLAAAPLAAAPNAPLLAAATAVRPEQLKLLETLVNIDSGTGDIAGGRRVAAILATELKALGATVESVAAEAPGLPDNLVATVKGTGKARILMIGHLDTVFDPGTAVKRPFRIAGDTAYGPGVGDEKGGVVAGVFALRLLRTLRFTDFATITYLIESSEERGSPGSRKLIDRLLAGADVELNLEPGSPPDAVTVWRKGSAAFTIAVAGKAAHAGVAPQDGHNAATELVHQLAGLDGFPRSGDGVTVNLTLLEAGTRQNIIPDRAQATLNARVRTADQFDAIDTRLKANAATVVVPGTKVTVARDINFPPLPDNPATAGLAARATAIYAGLGRTLTTAGSGGASESALAHARGVPALDGLGPVGGNFHSDAEYIDLRTVTPRLYLLTALIIDVATKPVPR